MAFARIVGRVWIPLVVLLVIACGAYIVSSLQSAFGSQKVPRYAGSDIRTESLHHKELVYEVFGPSGTVADINYFDMHSQPQQVNGASLPWSLKMTSDSPSVIGSIVAQGDSNTIGCRIVVDGKVEAERVSNEVNAFTHCLVQGA